MGRCLTALALWMVGGVAFADDALRFEAITTVQHGVEDPRLMVSVRVGGVMDLKLDCGGRNFDGTFTLAPDSLMTIPLKGLAQGVHQCVGSIYLEARDGSTGDMPLSLKVSSLPLISLQSSREELDLKARTLKVRADRPLQAAMVSVYGPRGVLLAQANADLSDPLAPFFQWEQAEAEVVKLEVEVRDQNNFRTKLTLSPWSYAIPHEDVVFASGSAEITTAEAPKLESTWEEIGRVLELYGEVVQIRLFVAGFTDTVGDAGSNQILSERRAKAIAGWFRKRGFSGPIAYQGFGERVLVVQTGDEVDEVSNRRAAYILAAQAPPVSEHLPSEAWRPL